MLNISPYSTSESSNNSSKRSTESAIIIFSLVLLFVFSRETWNVMAWDGLDQPTGKYRSIRHMEYPKFQTRIFGQMESAPYLSPKVPTKLIIFPNIGRLCYKQLTMTELKSPGE